MVKLTAAYREAFESLNKEQLRAVKQIDGPVLVVAGPGTGKTQLLTTRIGYILEATDSAPDNILCLTFSESAARNMQQRLARLIGPAAYDVTISTYHSFGSDLIRRYPDLFQLKDDITPADDLMLDQLVREIQSSLDYSNPLKSEFFVSDIKELISGYKRALITPEILEEVCSANMEFINQASRLVNDHLHPGERITAKQLPLYEQILEASLDLPAKAPTGITPLRTVWLDELGLAVEQARESGKMTTLSKWKAAWLENDGNGRFVVSSPRVNKRQQAMIEIFRAYNHELKARSLYDYDDMIMYAIDGLHGNPDIKLSLQERYQFILLDEFQDTNEAQLRLVELLADNPVNEGRPNILAVGDDDQAIYSFQGAHYSHMRRFYDNYERVELISLVTNYRSTPGIVELSTKIRNQIAAGLDLASKELSSNDQGKPEEIKRIELPLDAEQLAWAAEYVAKLIKQGTNAQDIAILAPKHRLLTEIIPYLHAHHVPVNYEQKDNVLEDDLIVQLLSCARLVIALSSKNHAAADSLWPIVLSYDFWQLPASLVWQLSWQARDNRKAWTEVVLNELATRAIGLFFIRLAQIESFTSFEVMINYLIGSEELVLNEKGLKSYTSPYYQQHFDGLGKQSETIAADEWRLLGHLSILRARAKASSEDGLNLEGLLNFVDSYNNAGLKITDTSPFQESSSAVKLMTAFASKGQEFKTVILIDMVDEVWGSNGRSQSSRIALPPNLSHVRLNTNNDDEKLRLLFVAASRARNRLVMTSYQNNLAGKQLSSLRYLREEQLDNKILSPLLPESSREVIKPRLPDIDLNEVKPAWFNAHLNTISPERRPLLEDRLKLFKLSATKLNAFSDLSRGGPVQFYLDSILQFPSAPSLSSQYGSAIHGTLDWQFKQTQKLGHPPDINAVIEEFSERLKKRRLAQKDFEQLTKRGSECLTAYFEQTEIVSGPSDLSEESFDANIGEARLVGEIDRLIVDRNNRTLHIIDFKTGQSYERWGQDIKPFHHARQLYFYKLLVESAPKFKGYTVSGATIQFVEPNKDDGKIKSLSLTFNEAEAQTLNQWIDCVWRKIMALDFPDCSGYPDTIKGIRQFESDLLNQD